MSSDVPQLELRIVRDIDEFRGLRSEWTQLANRLGCHNVFSTWEWNYSWWECYRARIPQSELSMILVYRGSQLVGLVPAYRDRSKWISTSLRMLGDQFETTLYPDFLIDPATAESVLKVLGDFLRTERIGFLQFSHVLPNAICEQFCSARPRVVRPSTDCPFVELPATFSDYLAGRRRDIQKDRTRLYQMLGAQLVDLSSTVSPPISSLFELHERNFAQRNKQTRFRQELRLSFHTRLIEYLRPMGRMYMLGVQHDARIVAISYGFLSGDRSVGYQLGYEMEYRKYRIGFQLILNDIEWAIGRGLVEHDLSAGGAAYKTVYSNEHRTICNSITALNRRAAWALAAFRVGLKTRAGVKAWNERRVQAAAARDQSKKSTKSS